MCVYSDEVKATEEHTMFGALDHMLSKIKYLISPLFFFYIILTWYLKRMVGILVFDFSWQAWMLIYIQALLGKYRINDGDVICVLL